MGLSISQRLFVSIHAPAWGATPRPLTGFLRHKSFNPRTRVGCDIRGDKEFGGDNWFQSTHPRGVRPQAGVPEVEAQAWFQSTHPRGVRHTLYKLLPQHWKFQSTHPRGVRRQRAAVCHVSNCVSIHAPAWGATAAGRCLPPVKLCFNPRTRVGCDAAAWLRGAAYEGFNPRTRVGCDLGPSALIIG